MSLEQDGVWKTGVWAPTVWADGVWREGAAPEPEPEPEPAPPRILLGAGGEFESWQDYVAAEFRKKHLQFELVKQEKKLKTVEKRIRSVEKSEKTEGILANLLRLEFKKQEIERKIEALEVEMIPLEMFLEAEIDDDDEEVMLLS